MWRHKSEILTIITGGFETPMSQVSNLQEDLDYEEACSSILSLPAGYITGASNECSRRFSVSDKDTGGDDQGMIIYKSTTTS